MAGRDSKPGEKALGRGRRTTDPFGRYDPGDVPTDPGRTVPSGPDEATFVSTEPEGKRPGRPRTSDSPFAAPSKKLVSQVSSLTNQGDGGPFAGEAGLSRDENIASVAIKGFRDDTRKFSRYFFNSHKVLSSNTDKRISDLFETDPGDRLRTVVAELGQVGYNLNASYDQGDVGRYQDEIVRTRNLLVSIIDLVRAALSDPGLGLTPADQARIAASIKDGLVVPLHNSFDGIVDITPGDDIVLDDPLQTDADFTAVRENDLSFDADEANDADETIRDYDPNSVLITGGHRTVELPELDLDDTGDDDYDDGDEAAITGRFDAVPAPLEAEKDVGVEAGSETGLDSFEKMMTRVADLHKTYQSALADVLSVNNGVISPDHRYYAVVDGKVAIGNRTDNAYSDFIAALKGERSIMDNLELDRAAPEHHQSRLMYTALLLEERLLEGMDYIDKAYTEINGTVNLEDDADLDALESWKDTVVAHARELLSGRSNNLSYLNATEPVTHFVKGSYGRVSSEDSLKVFKSVHADMSDDIWLVTDGDTQLSGMVKTIWNSLWEIALVQTNFVRTRPTEANAAFFESENIRDTVKVVNDVIDNFIRRVNKVMPLLGDAISRKREQMARASLSRPDSDRLAALREASDVDIDDPVLADFGEDTSRPLPSPSIDAGGFLGSAAPLPPSRSSAPAVPDAAPQSRPPGAEDRILTDDELAALRAALAPAVPDPPAEPKIARGRISPNSNGFTPAGFSNSNEYTSLPYRTAGGERIIDTGDLGTLRKAVGRDSASSNAEEGPDLSSARFGDWIEHDPSDGIEYGHMTPEISRLLTRAVAPVRSAVLEFLDASGKAVSDQERVQFDDGEVVPWEGGPVSYSVPIEEILAFIESMRDEMRTEANVDDLFVDSLRVVDGAEDMMRLIGRLDSLRLDSAGHLDVSSLTSFAELRGFVQMLGEEVSAAYSNSDPSLIRQSSATPFRSSALYEDAKVQELYNELEAPRGRKGFDTRETKDDSTIVSMVKSALTLLKTIEYWKHVSKPLDADAGFGFESVRALADDITGHAYSRLKSVHEALSEALKQVELPPSSRATDSPELVAAPELPWPVGEKIDRVAGIEPNGLSEMVPDALFESPDESRAVIVDKVLPNGLLYVLVMDGEGNPLPPLLRTPEDLLELLNRADYQFRGINPVI